MDEKTFNLETSKFQEILDEYKEVIEDYKTKFELLPKAHKNNPELLYSLLTQYQNKIELLSKTVTKPYFARIDFKSEDEGRTEECYIGKVGVIDSDNKIVVVDWRAPIASVYYDSNIGKTSYLAPQGDILGELLVKRQYNIENGILNSYQDVDIVSNDDILKSYLQASVDSRLKNIVASIQSEQNDIIREKINKNLIIQGVAGSGKTTVALHRIAYLVYNNMKNINSDQYMVIGPNKFFVNYISNILPDLDVDNVEQLTYAELVMKFIDEVFESSPDQDKLIKSIASQEKLAFERIRTSMMFKNAIDEYMNDFDRTIVPDIDFSIKGYNILPQSFISKIYNEVDKIDYFNIEARVERTHLLLGNCIEQEYDKIYSYVTNQFYDKCQSGDLSKDEIEKERKNLDFVKKELRNNCNQSLKKHFSKTKTKILDLYLNFMKNIDKYIDLEQYGINSISNTISNIKLRKIDFEDLAALSYLKYKMSGASDFKKYRHAVIDEAQDFGEFNFYVLKKIMPNGTFSIFGDLAQAIYSYRSIKNWQEVVETAFDNNCELKYLLKSYRTTAEIMNSANNIIKHIGLNSAEPVIRHGQFVNFTQAPKNEENYILTKINEYLSKGYSSIALICKDEEEASKLNIKLSSMGLKVRNIASTDVEYNGGICIITSYLSKGLEFDGVIIVDASEERYSSKITVDMKLLYVAMTRPLHELEVIYHGELCKPLQNSLSNIANIDDKATVR